MNAFKIKKSSGLLEEFNEIKLKKSLENSGVPKELVNQVLIKIRPKIKEGMSTRKIYQIAYRELKKASGKTAAHYRLKRATFDLGPSGFVFEQLVARMFEKQGYVTNTNVILGGRCIRHEIDVIAQKNGKKILVECKFHNSPGRINDLKTSLYIKGRMLDLLESEESEDFDEFWIVSNTKFSDEAIKYSLCTGIRLLGANHPIHHTINDWIVNSKVHPITCLSTLRKKDKDLLLEQGIILCSELIDNMAAIEGLRLGEKRTEQLQREVHNLCNNNGEKL